MGNGLLRLAIPCLALGFLLVAIASASTTVEVHLHDATTPSARFYQAGVFFRTNDAIQYQWSAFNGQATGSTQQPGFSSLSENTLADLQAAADQAWTLHAFTTQSNTQVESIYSFVPDLSGLTDQQLGSVVITAPVSGDVLFTSHPTLQWHSIYPYPSSATAYVYSADPSHYGQDQIIQSVNLNADGNWTVPSDLAPGPWHFQINGNWTLGSVPFTATLVSGPDIGLMATKADLYYAFDAGAEVTVSVPEPGTAFPGALACGCLVWRRRRTGKRR